jgi:hypothetical protein
MPRPAKSPGSPPREAAEPRSTAYVLCSAAMAALILGLTIFLLVRGFQWRGALAALRAEPGIEILSVERTGFFGKRLRGLRDPLAPPAEGILLRHNIGPRSAELVLAEYHSLNTPYARQREEAEAARLESLREVVLTAVGEFAEAAAKKREEDLEKITRMLFETRFPEAMKTVELEWREGAWYAKGELYAPEREVFVAEAPACVVEGELDFGGLVDLTEERTSTLRRQIESPDLLSVDLDERPVHLERMVRLVRDYDEVCERSRLPRPDLRLELAASDPPSALPALAALKAVLAAPGAIPRDRFREDLVRSEAPGGAARASLRLVPPDSPR